MTIAELFAGLTWINGAAQIKIVKEDQWDTPICDLNGSNLVCVRLPSGEWQIKIRVPDIQ